MSSISQIKSSSETFDIADISAREQLQAINNQLVSLQAEFVDLIKSGGTLDEIINELNDKVSRVTDNLQIPTRYIKTDYDVGKIWIENHTITKGE